jgi:hypothetical protein
VTRTCWRGTLKVGRKSVEPGRNPLVHISTTGQASPRPHPHPNEVMDHLHEIIVVPVTRTIRGLSTEPEGKGCRPAGQRNCRESSSANKNGGLRMTLPAPPMRVAPTSRR